MIQIEKSTPLRVIRDLGKDCKMCGSCCRHGAGMLIEEDLKRIARFLSVDAEKLKKNFLERVEMFNTKAWKPRLVKGGKPYGTCVFYDSKKGCEIHAAKPLQCAISNCKEYGEQLIQWFYLRYLVDPNDPESVRQWASYLKHKDWVIKGGNLDELVPDKEKLKKILSYGILK